MSSPFQKRCPKCRKKNRVEYIKKWIRERRRNDPEFREAQYELNRNWRQKNYVSARESNRNYVRRIKAFVLNEYGGVCACCRESEYEFLSMDHIDGGGRQHREKSGYKNIYVWLRRNDYPAGFRVLCHNCNMSFGQFGYCPHKDSEAHQRLLDSLVPNKSSPTTTIRTLKLSVFPSTSDSKAA